MEALVRSTMNGKKKKPEVVTQLLPDGTKEEKIIQPKAWWLSKIQHFFEISSFLTTTQGTFT